MDIEQYDIVPYIRQADYAIRPAFFLGKRSLLDYILFYVQEGEFEIQMRGKLYLLKAGDFYMLQPRDVHSIRGITDTINPYIHLDLFYNAHRIRSFITLPGQVDLTSYAELMQPRINDFAAFDIPAQLQFSQPQRMRNLMLRIIELWQLQTYISVLEANQLAYELIVSIIRDYRKPIPATLQTKPFLNWITSYISFHFSEPITIHDMANRAGISASRFQVVFKQTFGISPHQYLLKLRIEHARELLKTYHTIQQISEYCGFSDVHHFSNAFKKATGLTPARYRVAYQTANV